MTDPMDYQNSSHCFYLAPDKAFHWLSIDLALKFFGTTEEAAQAGYLYFMRQPVEEERLELLRKGGKEGQVKQLRNKLAEDSVCDPILLLLTFRLLVYILKNIR